MTHIALLTHLTYPGLIALLAGAGIYAPVPEELTLLTAGYLSALGVIALRYAVPLAVASLVIGDSILFGLAKVGAAHAKKVHEKFLASGLDKTWIFNPDRPLRAVFLLRFVTGLRMISPVFAGLNGASWAAFLLVDLAALLIFVPVMFGLGFYFHANFFRFVTVFEIARHAVFWTIVAVAGGSVLAALHPRVRRAVERVRGKRHEGGD